MKNLRDWTPAEAETIVIAERELRRPFSSLERKMIRRPVTLDKLLVFVQTIRDVEDHEARACAARGNHAEWFSYDDGWGD
jgi:hypothetical protein